MSPDRPTDRPGGKPNAPLRLIVGIIVSVGAVATLILHIANPTWKIDSVAVALLVVAALPWLGEILESVDFPGGGGFHYRERLRNVEAKTNRVEETLGLLIDIFPLILPDNLLQHLRHLDNSKTKGYYGSKPLQEELRQLRNMHLISVCPPYSRIGDVPIRGAFDLAKFVKLTDDGTDWIGKAHELEAFYARRPH